MAEDKEIDLGEAFGIKLIPGQAPARGRRAADPLPVDGDADDDLPAMDELSPLPRPGDPYVPYARPANRPLPTLFLIKADGSVRGYPFAGRAEGPHLVPASEAGKGWSIVMRYWGIPPAEVVMSGRKLDNLVNLLAAGRVAWVRELPEGKLPANLDGPVVTAIIVREAER